jgi:hypothetical protein
MEKREHFYKMEIFSLSEEFAKDKDSQLDLESVLERFYLP